MGFFCQFFFLLRVLYQTYRMTSLSVAKDLRGGGEGGPYENCLMSMGYNGNM